MAPRQTNNGAPPDPGEAPKPTDSQGNVPAPNPIGVPYAVPVIDPTTGTAAVGPDGTPIYKPFTASVPGGHWYDHVTGATVEVPPRYFSGAEWLPGSLPPDKIAALQKGMVQAGLLKPGQAQLGIWDPASVNAYQNLLAFANSSGLDAQTALMRWQSAHTQTGDTGTPHQPLVVQLTNPDDLKQVFRKAVIDTLGQGWTSDQLDQMVNTYQGMQRSAQEQQYQMTGSGSSTDPGQGGTITAPPDPTTFATQQAQQQNPNLAQEHSALGFVDQFKQLVGQYS